MVLEISFDNGKKWHREVLRGKALTFLCASVILLGVLILIFVAFNALFFDTGKGTETLGGSHSNLSDSNNAPIWLGAACIGSLYVITVLLVAIQINRIQQGDKTKRKGNPKRKNTHSS